MEEHFEDDRRFMISLMGAGKGIEEVQARTADILVPGMLSIDLGGRTVEVRHFGFAQTPGDLVVWTPSAKVLWVGNMIQAPSPALPWLLEERHKETIATLSRVRNFLPEDATIIPGHGRPMRPADIEFPLQYLRKLDGVVRAAIEEGRSVEATLDVAAMPDHGAYSLFEWAHKTVNVPAVYRDLRDTEKDELSGGWQEQRRSHTRLGHQPRLAQETTWIRISQVAVALCWLSSCSPQRSALGQNAARLQRAK